VLAELSGDLPPDPSAALAPVRAALAEEIEADTVFGGIARRCRLPFDHAEVFAVCAAVESDPRLQRLVAVIADDMAQRRVTVGLLAELLGEDQRAAAAVAPDAPLRRACLVDLGPVGPLGARSIEPASHAVWALLGDASFDPALP